jgi:ATP-binding protein involved in chromosome partitioning
MAPHAGLATHLPRAFGRYTTARKQDQNMSAEHEARLGALLPPQVAARKVSLKLAQGVATLMLEASGLDAAGRAALEAEATAALAGAEGVEQVRVGLMAERPAGAAPAPAPAPHGHAPHGHAPAAQPARGGPLILAVGSGKGGVGKSTLSANLAVALARRGIKVGLVDADIYGPSQPKLMANEGQRPQARDGKLLPVASPHGVAVLSVGHLVEADKAIAWRGPMAAGALGQLLDADWGDTQLLVVDLPPGTGDVQLTMVQRYKPVGAVIVSTPQDLALIDARRAISLFEQVGVPVVGMVENMAGYVCPHCGNVSDPFGSGGVEANAAALEVPFLGRVPLDLAIRLASDAGTPPATTDTPQGAAFARIATRLAAWLEPQLAAHKA